MIHVRFLNIKCFGGKNLKYSIPVLRRLAFLGSCGGGAYEWDSGEECKGGGTIY